MLEVEVVVNVAGEDEEAVASCCASCRNNRRGASCRSVCRSS